MPSALTRIHSNSSHPKKTTCKVIFLSPLSSIIGQPFASTTCPATIKIATNKQHDWWATKQNKKKQRKRPPSMVQSIRSKIRGKITRGANRLFKWPPAKKCKKEAAPAFASIANQKKEAGREVLIVRSIGRQPKNAKKMPAI